MDSHSKVMEPLETKDEEPAVHNSENASSILTNGMLVTPQKPATEATPNRCETPVFKSPLNFSTVTVEQLGITPESFVKNSSGKSSAYLKKARRRSAIGARGSPETNHLICFIAQQRNAKDAKKSPLAHNSPFQGSPVLYRNANSLRERISAFQSAFHSVKEQENMDDGPESSEAERERKATDIIEREGLREWQQSGFSVKSPAKRQRVSYQSNLNENLADAEKIGINLQLFNTDASSGTDRPCTVGTSPAELSEKSGPGIMQSSCLVEEPVPLLGLSEVSCGIQVADCVKDQRTSAAVSQRTWLGGALPEAASVDPVPADESPATSVSEKDALSSQTFVLRSVLKKPSVKLFLESLQDRSDNCGDGIHPSIISNFGNYCKEQKTVDQQNLKVPAFPHVRKRVTFGEDLSPEVFDESLPANTPVRKGEAPLSRRDFPRAGPLQLNYSPERVSPPNFDDKGENLENIEPLPASFGVLSPSKSSVSETPSGTDTSNLQETVSSHDVGRITRAANRRSQLTSFTEETICNLVNTEAQHCKEKKIIRRKSQEIKQTNRALPKNHVCKGGRRKKKKGKQQSAKKSLYGERETVSKKPLLSPIPEIPEVTPVVPGARRRCAGNVNSKGNPEEVLTLPQCLIERPAEDPGLPPDLAECDVPGSCSPCVKKTFLPGCATFDHNSNIHTVEVKENIPKAKSQLESENELKKAAPGNVNDGPSSDPVTEEYVVSRYPRPHFTLQAQELGNRGQISKIPKDESTGHGKGGDLLIADEEKPESSHLVSDSLKEVFNENVEESKGPSEGPGRKSSGTSSEMTCQERKQRRRAMCYPNSKSAQLGEDGSHEHASRVGTSVGITLENPELCKELSDAIEQTLKRPHAETKVRRSTRLRKDLENEGLIWVSLPAGCPAPSTNQKMKRRTVCAFDNRGFEHASSGKTPGPRPSTADTDNSKGRAAGSLERRRMSFCTSSLANAKPPLNQDAAENPFSARGKKPSNWL
ncbi:cell division cycle-associated protein 2 [Echinops telfairi]|uniref:Cell division cycle-associated protein 2 n=1 Tax=Echinops telfairi TaxID=9371 RepID=A0ABM0ZRL9_ECHTE|nr:cell division cycle-associated protein 2 [Echinops telfairi]